MAKCLVFHGIHEIVPALQHILIFIQITKYSSPVAISVFRPRLITIFQFEKLYDTVPNILH